MLDERYILKSGMIQRFIAHIGWTPADFAYALDIEMEESYKLLSGEPVNYYVAKKLIHYISAVFAVEFSDWLAMEIEQPDLKIRSVCKDVADDVLFSMLASNIQDLEKEKGLR